jgi:putative (di)nucleoside polyphosphate hydrolase
MAVESLPYRPCVGLALFNRDGKVFVGERVDFPGAWQMPQGGIDPGEYIHTAAFRELYEETGTDKAEILEISEDPLHYDLPPDLQGKLWGGQFRGQEQIWIALRFTGEDHDINLRAHQPPEFQAWQWVHLDKVPDLIVPFKQKTYREVIRRFRRFSISLT